MGRVVALILLLACDWSEGNSSGATSYRSSQGQQRRLTQPMSQQQKPGTSSCKSQPPDLNYHHAMEMLRLVTEKAKEKKIPVVICIRDRHDNLVAHVRMKNALLGSVDLACQKARSSALFPFPSGAFKQAPGIELSNGLLSPLAGGLPLTTASGVSAGSIGVSGAMTGEEDEEIAKVAMDAIDSILKRYW